MAISDEKVVDSRLQKREVEETSLEDLEKKSYQNGQLEMPSQLAALSEAEYEKLGKSATFKMDLLIMPSLVVMYIMNYLDRQNIAAAKLANITVDLALSPVQYQTCVSILFVGYSKFNSVLPREWGICGLDG
jgi:hypothetical protein